MDLQKLIVWRYFSGLGAASAPARVQDYPLNRRLVGSILQTKCSRDPQVCRWPSGRAETLRIYNK